MNEQQTPLKFLAPAWFSMVMGLCGLALAWHRAASTMGESATAAALALAVMATAVAAALAVASVVRWNRYSQAWVSDLLHPVRHAFVAALPASLILLSTVGTALLGPAPWLAGVWMTGAVWQFAVTVWVLRRWLGSGPGQGLAWASVTPVLFIPVVGNVLVPLAGVPLGFVQWSTAQFAIGLFFWPILTVLLAARIALEGLWPERLLPSTFISAAPPSVIGLAALQLGAPEAAGWAAWGLGLFFLAWSVAVVRRMLAQPFSMAFWGLSFPLAAFAALSLRLAAQTPGLFSTFSILVLASVSLVVAALLLATARGLRQGTLLVPEPVAAVVATRTQA